MFLYWIRKAKKGSVLALSKHFKSTIILLRLGYKSNRKRNSLYVDAILHSSLRDMKAVLVN